MALEIIFIYLNIIFMHNHYNKQPCQCLLVAITSFFLLFYRVLNPEGPSSYFLLNSFRSEGWKEGGGMGFFFGPFYLLYS